MRSHPVQRRIEMLSDQWARFVSTRDARLLCWQLTAAEQRVLDALVELESDEATAEHATVFITLDTPFEEPASHGRWLADQLWGGMNQGEQELRALGLKLGFRLPPLAKHESDPAYLVRCCESFVDHFEIRSELALILRPSACADAVSYRHWLAGLARAASERVRVIVIDDADAPVLTPLQAEGTKVAIVRAALDVPGALVELSSAAGRLDTPGGQFRDLFVLMGAALQRGDLDRALVHGDSAVEVANSHGLMHLAVPVHIALGANLLGQQRTDEGLGRYLAAQAAAELGSEQPDTALAGLCRKLLVQSRMAHGAGLAGLRRYREAAPVFEQTAPLAQAEGDQASVLDCHRLASFCYEQASDMEQAWRVAVRGLAAAHELDPVARRLSSFSSLDEALQRMAAARAPGTTRELAEVLDQLRELRRQKPSEARAPGQSHVGP